MNEESRPKAAPQIPDANREPAGSVASTRAAQLATLIINRADRNGVCPRALLRDAYRDWVPQPTRASTNHQPSAFGGATQGKRLTNRNQAFDAGLRGFRWDSKRASRGSHGLKSSDTLSRDLGRLERCGAIVREGADIVRVVDGDALAAVARHGLPDLDRRQ